MANNLFHSSLSCLYCQEQVLTSSAVTSLSVGAEAQDAPQEENSSAGKARAGTLNRALTARQIAMLGLSGAMGTGLFLGSAGVIKTAGPAIIVSYLVCGMLAFLITWLLAEMTTVHPVTGGFGASAQAYLGPMGGFVARWNYGVCMCIAVGAQVTAAASYFRYWWPGLNLGLVTILLSVVMVGLNLAAVKDFGVGSYWFSMIKLAVVAVFVILGAVLLFFGLPGSPAVGLGNLTGHGGFFATGTHGVMAGVLMAVFSYGGSENVAVAAAESEDPRRNVPRASFSMIGQLVAAYVLAIAVVVAMQPWTLTSSSDGSLGGSPFVRVLAMAGLPGAAPFMNGVLVVAALSAAISCMYGSARMFHSLAQDKMAPSIIARTATNGTPRNAVLLATFGMIIASVLALYRPDDAFMLLFGVLVFALLLNWMLIAITHARFRTLRARHGLPASPVRLPGAPFTSWALVAVLGLIGVGVFFTPSLQIAWLAGLPYLCLLLASYLIVRRHASRDSVLTEELAEHTS